MKKEVCLIKMSRTEERLIIFHRLRTMSHILIFKCLSQTFVSQAPRSRHPPRSQSVSF